VLKEAMRLIPAARVGMRKATRDLNFDGIMVPQGSIVVYSIDALHALEPTLWQGPESIPKGATLPPYMDFRRNLREAFRPERWLGPNKPKNFTTFGMGAHLCLGMNLVNTELKLFLLQLLRQGVEWNMEVEGVLKKMTLFPGVSPPPGADWMRFKVRPDLVMEPIK
jgi:cytochrome P450